MATAKEDAQVRGKVLHCQFCGRLADAVWRCDNDIAVCLWCGRQILAALLADSLVNRFGPATVDHWQQISDHLKAFEAQYYRALVIQLCRMAKEAQLADQ